MKVFFQEYKWLLGLLITVFVVSISYKNKKVEKKGHNLYPIYVLLLIFWILNIIDTLIPIPAEHYKIADGRNSNMTNQISSVNQQFQPKTT